MNENNKSVKEFPELNVETFAPDLQNAKLSPAKAKKTSKRLGKVSPETSRRENNIYQFEPRKIVAPVESAREDELLELEACSDNLAQVGILPGDAIFVKTHYRVEDIADGSLLILETGGVQFCKEVSLDKNGEIVYQGGNPFDPRDYMFAETTKIIGKVEYLMRSYAVQDR